MNLDYEASIFYFYQVYPSDMKYTFTLLEIKIPMFILAEVFRVKPVSKTLSCESITFRLYTMKKKKRQQTYTVLFQ